MSGDDDTRVTFTVKELIGDINRKLDAVLTALHGKADTSRVQALEARVDGVERSVAALEQREEVQERHDERSTQRRRWVVDAGVGLLLVGATIGLMLATMH